MVGGSGGNRSRNKDRVRSVNALFRQGDGEVPSGGFTTAGYLLPGERPCGEEKILEIWQEQVHFQLHGPRLRAFQRRSEVVQMARYPSHLVTEAATASRKANPEGHLLLREWFARSYATFHQPRQGPQDLRADS